MLVVLAVLAAMTVVAVQSLTPLASEVRYEGTMRTLGNISAAVVTVNKQSVSGFLADTGRLPAYSSTISSTPYSVDELTGFYPATSTYGPPSDLGVYQTVSVPMTMYATSTTTTSTTLTVNTGWNGPYLLAPSGSYASTSTTSIVDGWGQALPAFLYPDTSHGGGMTIWSTGDPTTGVAISTTIVPSTLAASTMLLNGYNSSGVSASPSWGTAPYYYAVYGPAPVSLFATAPSTISAAASGGQPYLVAEGAASGSNPAPGVYRYVASYSSSYSLVNTSAAIPGPHVPGLGPRVFCILDSNGNIVSGPVYQVVIPGSNTVNFLVQ